MPDAVPLDPLLVRLLTGVVIGVTLGLAGRAARRVMQVLLSVAALSMIYVLLRSGPAALIQSVQGVVAETLLHPAVLLGALAGVAAFHEPDTAGERS